MPKLLWQVKLVAELEPGVATETEVARFERGEEAGLADLGLRLEEAKRLSVCPAITATIDAAFLAQIQGQWLPQELQARQQGLRRGQASLGQQLERLTEAYLGSVVLLDEYRRRRRDLEERQRQLEEQARQLEA